MPWGCGTHFGVSANDRLSGPSFASPHAGPHSIWLRHMRNARTAYGGGTSLAVSVGNTGTLSISSSHVLSYVGSPTTSWAVDVGFPLERWVGVGVAVDGSSSANDPSVYHDGRKKTVGAGLTQSGADSAFSTLSTLSLGGRVSLARPAAGMYEDLVLWDTILSDDEFALLEDGESPLNIQRDHVLLYFPLDEFWQLTCAVSGLSMAPLAGSTYGAFYDRHSDPRLYRQHQRDMDLRRVYFGSAGGAAAALGGAAAGVSTATATLATAIPLQGSAAGAATGTGALTSGIPLAVAAAVKAAATGALTAEIRFDGTALAIATGVAALSTGIALGGNAIAAAVATGALTTGGGGLEGAAMAKALAAGDLTTAVLLASDAFAAAIAQAGLTTGIPLTSAAQSVGTATATLTTSINLAGQGSAVASAVGDLTGGAGSAQLQGAAQVVAIAAGDLTTGIPLVGAGVASAIANGSLVVQIALVGSALAQAIAQGGLTTAIQLSGVASGSASASGSLGPSGILVIDPRFHAIAPARSWAVAA